MRYLWLATLLTLPLPGQTPTAAYQPLTRSERARLFWNDTLLRPPIYLEALAAASVSQLNNAPPEWRQGAEGYARRSASTLGTFGVQAAIHQGGAAALGYDPRYLPCGCRGFVQRSAHAVKWSLLTKNSAGATRLDVPVIAGAYGSGMLSTLWYPDRYDPLKDGLRAGSQQLAFGAGANWLREFAPELKRALHLGK